VVCAGALPWVHGGSATFDDSAAVRATSAIDPGTSIDVQVDDAEWSYDTVTGAARSVLVVDDDEVAYTGFPAFPNARQPSLRFFLQGLRNIGFQVAPTNDCDDGGWDGVLWDTATCGVVPALTLASYDLVIWYTGEADETAVAGATLLTPADNAATVANLTTYLDAGGDLLLASHEYIDAAITNAAVGGCGGAAPYFDSIAACTDVANAAFIGTYLGVTDYALQNRSTSGTSTPPGPHDTQPIPYVGTVGDPVGDGVSLRIRGRGGYREATVGDLVLAGGVNDFPVLEDNDARYGGNAAVLTCLPSCNPAAVARTNAAGPPGSGRVVFSTTFLENQANAADDSNFRTLFGQAVRYLADAPTVTVTNPRSGEIETLTLSNSGLGISTGVLLTAAGATPNVTVGTMNVLAGDTLTTEYTDASPGATSTDTTSVVTTAALSFVDGSGSPLTTIPVPGSVVLQVDDADRNTSAAADSFGPVTVTSTPGSGAPDSEDLTVTETGPSTGVFRSAAIPTALSDSGTNDGTLRVAEPGTVSASLTELGAEVTKVFAQETWTGGASDNVVAIGTTGWTELDSVSELDPDENEYVVVENTGVLSNEWLANELPPNPNPVLVGYKDHPTVAGTPIDADGAGDVSVVRDPTTGDFRMYYSAATGFTPSIALAVSTADTSPIGRDFSKYPSDDAAATLFALGGVGTIDQCGAGSPSVVYDPSAVDGPWVMFFAADDCTFAGFPNGMGRAASADGLTWTVDDTTALFTVGGVGDFDELSINDPAVLVETAAGPEKYKMWYTGLNGSFAPQIGYAESADGITWTKVDGVAGGAQDPVVGFGGTNDPDETGAGSPTVAYDSAASLYVMYYEAGGPALGCPDDPALFGGIARAESATGLEGSWVKPVSPAEQQVTCGTSGAPPSSYENYVLASNSLLSWTFGVSSPYLVVDPPDGIDRLYFDGSTESGSAVGMAWNFDDATAAGELYANPLDTFTPGFVTTEVGAMLTTRLGMQGTVASARTSDTLADLLFDPAPGVAYPSSPPNPNITEGALLSDFPLVTNGQRYLQYELEMTADTTVPDGPFSGAALTFTDAYETVDPEVFQRPVSTSSVSAAVEETASDATVRISDVTFTLNPSEQQVTYDLTTTLDRTVKQVVDVNGDVVLPGDQLDYTIDVVNSGPTALTGVVVSDTVPLGTDYLAGSIFGTGADAGSLPVLRWLLGTLDPGEVETIGFSVIVQDDVGQGSELLNQAFVNSVETGVVPSDDPTTTPRRDPTLIPVGAGLLALLGAAAAAAGAVVFVRHRPRRFQRKGAALSAVLIVGAASVGGLLTAGQPAVGQTTSNDVYVEVVDADQNADPGSVNTVAATVASSSGDTESVTLSETDPTTGAQSTNSSTFRGSVRAVLDDVAVPGNGLLEVEPFDTITLSYLDQTNTTGQPVTRTDSVTATVDHVYIVAVVARQPVLLPGGGLEAPIDAQLLNVFGLPAPDGTDVTFATQDGSIAPTTDQTASGVASSVFSSAQVVNPSVVSAATVTQGTTDTGTVELTTNVGTSGSTTTTNAPLNQPPDVGVSGPPANQPPASQPPPDQPATPPANQPPANAPVQAPTVQPSAAGTNDLFSSDGWFALVDATDRFIMPISAGLAALNLLLAVSLGSWYPYLLRIFLEPLQVFVRRRKRPWGIVYDSLTKQPVDLAIVRLFREDGSLARTSVTDRAGRYGFLVDQPGRYRIEVVKGDARLSTLLGGKVADGQYDRLYTGGLVSVAQPTYINFNLPLDRRAAELPVRDVLRRHYRRATHAFVAYSGVALGLAAYLVARTNLALVLLGLHVLVFLLFRRLAAGRRSRPWGVTFDRVTGSSLPHAVVRIYDQQYGRQLESQVADRYGRFGFLVGQNAYRIDAVKDGYRFPAAAKTKPKDYTGGTIQPKEAQAIVSVDLPMDRAEGTPTTGVANS